jgi:predicted RNase H-like HicB family nuclease
MNQARAEEVPLRIRVGRYAGVFEKTGTGYSAYVPSLPGLAVTGVTLEEAISELRSGIAFHLDGIARDKAERPWLYPEHA